MASLSITGFLVVLLTCLLWGGSIPTIKISEHGFPPLFMATGRITVATLLLWCYCRFIGEPVMIPRKDWWHGAALGLVFGLTMIFLYMGLVFTNAARGTIFYSTKPFWVALGAHFLMADDRLNLHKVAGLGLALFGIYLTFRTPGAAGLEGDWGNVMEIAAAMCFSATALYTKWLSQREKLSHFQTLFAMMLFSIPVASRFMRALYGLAKGVIFGFLYLTWALALKDPNILITLHPVNQSLIFFTTGLCIIRGLPVIQDGRILFRTEKI